MSLQGHGPTAPGGAARAPQAGAGADRGSPTSALPPGACFALGDLIFGPSALLSPDQGEAGLRTPPKKTYRGGGGGLEGEMPTPCPPPPHSPRAAAAAAVAHVAPSSAQQERLVAGHSPCFLLPGPRQLPGSVSLARVSRQRRAGAVRAIYRGAPGSRLQPQAGSCPCPGLRKLSEGKLWACGCAKAQLAALKVCSVAPRLPPVPFTHPLYPGEIPPAHALGCAPRSWLWSCC